MLSLILVEFGFVSEHYFFSIVFDRYPLWKLFEIADFRIDPDRISSGCTTNLIGASTDSEFVHLAWRKNHDDLRDLKFPMLADTSKSLAEELGILERSEKVAYRATFIIDPQGIVRWVSVYDLNVGRSVKEVIRVLGALQTG